MVECQPDEAQDPIWYVPNMRMKLCSGIVLDGCLGNVVKVGCILRQLLATWTMPVNGNVVLSIGDPMEQEFLPSLDDACYKSLCVRGHSQYVSRFIGMSMKSSMHLSAI
ncbi:hypothetical protein Tco_1122574 [Tanacetum coccineum]|uniref:Uncharacterized protein n=1 Tax=Tanacetum coccineum TaxID=301880 RepID=A0ABQ5J0Y8_9ASTR